mgnify:CR=1 FL=1
MMHNLSPENSVIKLYETPRTRSARCRWVLQELDVPFEAIQVNLSQGEHRQNEFLKLNPYGRVPVLVDDDVILSESIAICLYLADKYKDRGIIPLPGTPERGIHDQWLLFCATEMDQPLWQIRRHTALYPVELCLPEEVAISRNNFKRAADILEAGLGSKSNLTNSGFTVVDIVITQTLIWAAGYGLLSDHSKLETYITHHKARNSCPKELLS